jgi:outer membrane protein insertion porin family
MDRVVGRSGDRLNTQSFALRLPWFVVGWEISMRYCRFLSEFLLVGLLCTTGLTAAQGAGGFKLAGVKVLGSTRYSESEIARGGGLKIGENVTPDTLKEAAGRLGASGVFAELNYRYRTLGDQLWAEFTVRDGGKFLPCRFANFVWFTPDELLAGLRSRVPLFNGQVPESGELLGRISSALEGMLKERGIEAQVESSPDQNLGGQVEDMAFRVVGLTLPVAKVAFAGVQKVDAGLLRDAAQPLLGKDFDSSFVNQFANRSIVRVYRQRGYLRARFGDPAVQFLKGEGPPNALLVTLPVTEGAQYRLKEIAWSGESVIPNADLVKSIRQAPGGVVDAVQLEQDVFALPMLYHDKGYLTANILPEASLDDATHAAVYKMMIRQGDLFRMGKLEISGVDEAQARSLQKLSRLRTGDPFQKSDFDAFVRQVLTALPRTASGWRATTRLDTHHDTKTVDVTLIIAPGPAR